MKAVETGPGDTQPRSEETPVDSLDTAVRKQARALLEGCFVNY